ncbi:zinc finger protein Xfin-like [Neocloeon triangulifer]|uniref:zinc finger protein Xfin-like n=1 Tax=Neocloeon triangulifer TaxID=2078957 RepID=UPI00286F3259|nr:zinc finger protein Xfin-like [Neocloeon triangulifer]
MHPFCRFCLSPADKVITLEDLGVERMQHWASLNLGVELNFCPGFSTSICWACVTTFQFWANMIKDRAECQGDEHLGSQNVWWDDLSSSQQNNNSKQIVESITEMEPEVENVIELQEQSVCPIIEAIHPSVDLKNCSVKISALSDDFIRRCCEGSVNLAAMTAGFPGVKSHLKCRTCSIVFDDVTGKRRHIYKVHPDLKSCPYCLNSFAANFNLVKHVIEKKCCIKSLGKTQLQFFCPKCNVSRGDLKSLQEHFVSKHCGAYQSKLPDWMGSCCRCSNVYFVKKQLDDHFKYTHEIYSCKNCVAKFKSKVVLVGHIAEQHTDIKFSKFYKRTDNRSILLCIACDAKFGTEMRMAKHFLNFHPELLKMLEHPNVVFDLAEEAASCEKIPYLDPESADDYTQEKSWIRNIETVDSEKLAAKPPGFKALQRLFPPLKCPQCSKSYYRNSTLKIHMKVHQTKDTEKQEIKKEQPSEYLISGTGSDEQQSLDSIATDQVGMPNQQEVDEEVDQEGQPKPIIAEKMQRKKQFPCKYCNTASYSQSSSLLRHVKQRHSLISKCSECCMGYVEGKVCSTHRSILSAAKVKAAKAQTPTPSKTASVEPSKDKDGKEGKEETSKEIEEKAAEETKVAEPKVFTRVTRPKRAIPSVVFAKPIKCPGCSFTAKGGFELKSHINICTNLSQHLKMRIKKMSYSTLPSIKLVSCKVCQRLFLSPGSLVGHMKTAHPDRIHFVCRICGSTFLSKSQLENHFKMRHKNKSAAYYGPRPKKKENSNTSKSSQEGAAKVVVGSRNIVNDPSKCLKELPPGVNRIGNKMTCPFCPSVFESLMILEEHAMLAHATEYRFACRLCSNKKFIYQSSLYKHIRMEHPEESPKRTPQTQSSKRKALPLILKPGHPEAAAGKEIQDPRLSGTPSRPNADQEASNIKKMKFTMGQEADSFVSEEEMNSSATQRALISPKYASPAENMELEMEKCNYCDYFFIDHKSKVMHLNSFHKKSEDLSCHLCSRSFSSRVVFSMHINECRGIRITKPILKNLVEINCSHCSFKGSLDIVRSHESKYHMTHTSLQAADEERTRTVERDKIETIQEAPGGISSAKLPEIQDPLANLSEEKLKQEEKKLDYKESITLKYPPAKNYLGGKNLKPGEVCVSPPKVFDIPKTHKTLLPASPAKKICTSPSIVFHKTIKLKSPQEVDPTTVPPVQSAEVCNLPPNEEVPKIVEKTSPKAASPVPPLLPLSGHTSKILITSSGHKPDDKALMKQISPVLVPGKPYKTCGLCKKSFATPELVANHILLTHRVSMADSKGNMVDDSAVLGSPTVSKSTLVLMPPPASAQPPQSVITNKGGLKLVFLKCQICSTFVSQDHFEGHLKSH